MGGSIIDLSNGRYNSPAVFILFSHTHNIETWYTISVSTSQALIVSNIIAGIHSVLIFFFLVGWLIPFASLRVRCVLNAFVGGAFLFFRWVGECPLTTWEWQFRGMSESTVSQSSFLSRQISFFGITVGDATLSLYSLPLTLGIVSLVLTSLYIAFLFKRCSSLSL